MGENQNRPFHFSFNSSLKVDFQGSRDTPDAGLLVVRELDERLGLSELISDNLTDARRGSNTQLPLPDLLRQSVYSRLAGYDHRPHGRLILRQHGGSPCLGRRHRVTQNRIITRRAAVGRAARDKGFGLPVPVQPAKFSSRRDRAAGSAHRASYSTTWTFGSLATAA